MGTDEQDAKYDDANPAHWVTLTYPFEIMRTEVTQRLYEEVTGSNPSVQSFDGFSLLDPSYPATNISWKVAVEFANLLSEAQGLEPAYLQSSGGVTLNMAASGWRLPTEAEWEFAASPSAKAVRQCDAANVLDKATVERWPLLTSQDVFPCSDGNPGLAKVSSLQANQRGIHDSIGNVWEWTWDFYGPYNPDEQANPLGPRNGTERTLRGGGWGSGREEAGLRIRNRGDPSMRDGVQDVGFRLVRTVE